MRCQHFPYSIKKDFQIKGSAEGTKDQSRSDRKQEYILCFIALLDSKTLPCITALDAIHASVASKAKVLSQQVTRPN